MADAFAAWAHFVSIFLVFSCLTAELILYRATMTGEIVRRLRRIDAGFGLSAALIVATGLVRIHYAKGSDVYVHDRMFWLKMALVATVALLSALPTAHFLRLPRKAPDVAIAIDRETYRRIRATLWAEAILLGLIPLAATLLARGVGL